MNGAGTTRASTVAVKRRWRLGRWAGECGRCHKDVLWLRNGVGGKVAVDPQRCPDDDGLLLVDLGRGLAVERGPDDRIGDDGTYLPHTISCPYTNRPGADSEPAVRARPVCGKRVDGLFETGTCKLPRGHKDDLCQM